LRANQCNSQGHPDQCGAVGEILVRDSEGRPGPFASLSPLTAALQRQLSFRRLHVAPQWPDAAAASFARNASQSDDEKVVRIATSTLRASAPSRRKLISNVPAAFSVPNRAPIAPKIVPRIPTTYFAGFAQATGLRVIAVEQYGAGSKDRLTGAHETAHWSEFSYGTSDRGASVRIPWGVSKAKKGWIEDRRPNANMDPYVVTRLIMETCCGALAESSEEVAV